MGCDFSASWCVGWIVPRCPFGPVSALFQCIRMRHARTGKGGGRGGLGWRTIYILALTDFAAKISFGVILSSLGSVRQATVIVIGCGWYFANERDGWRGHDVALAATGIARIGACRTGGVAFDVSRDPRGP